MATSQPPLLLQIFPNLGLNNHIITRLPKNTNIISTACLANPIIQACPIASIKIKLTTHNLFKTIVDK